MKRKKKIVFEGKEERIWKIEDRILKEGVRRWQIEVRKLEQNLSETKC